MFAVRGLGFGSMLGLSLMLAGACGQNTREFTDGEAGEGGAEGGSGGTSAVSGATSHGGTVGGDGQAGSEPSGAGAGGQAGQTGGLPMVDGPCDEEGTLACSGVAQKLRLVCTDGTWQEAEACDEADNCDQSSGLCAAIADECQERMGGDRFCAESDVVMQCGADLVSIAEIEACVGKCVSVDKSADCAPETCGDSKVQATEDCDDGNDSNSDACTNACKSAQCTDGATWTDHEQCDDGNAVDTDGCTNECKTPTCGDSITWAGKEQCDDGNAVDTDGCTNECKTPTCGDSITWAGKEQCDDGNAAATDGCTNECKTPTCGDSITWAGHEQCDDGNAVDTDACSNVCALPDPDWALWPMPNPLASGLPKPASYSVGSGVVTDNVTGLIWQQAVGSGTYAQAEATAYCENLSLGGATDWRLPTVVELTSLVDYTVEYPGPTIDAGAFPATPAQDYRTLTISSTDPMRAAIVDFQTGEPSSNTTDKLYGVRCLRSIVAPNANPGAPVGRYAVSGGTVTDKETGLIWQQAVDATTRSQPDAVAYCGALVLGGSSSWRTPSYKELFTLVDTSRANPSIDPTAFPGTGSVSFWTSTLGVADASYAKYVSFTSGFVSNSKGTVLRPVRCVR